jgi:hypothetical protein
MGLSAMGLSLLVDLSAIARSSVCSSDAILRSSDALLRNACSLPAIQHAADRRSSGALRLAALPGAR